MKFSSAFTAALAGCLLMGVNAEQQLRGGFNYERDGGEHEHRSLQERVNEAVDFSPYNPDYYRYVLGMFTAGTETPSGQTYAITSTNEALNPDGTMEWGTLQIGLSDVDATNAAETKSISGGWEVDFDVGSASATYSLIVSVRYLTFFEECFGDQDVGKVLISIDGGTPQEAWNSMSGSRGHGSDFSTAVATFDGLAAGAHTIEVGASLDYGTSTRANCAAGVDHEFQVRFENLMLATMGTGRKLADQEENDAAKFMAEE